MKGYQPTHTAANTDGLNLVAQTGENRNGPTVDAAKMPNAIYVGEIRYPPGGGL